MKENFKLKKTFYSSKNFLSFSKSENEAKKILMDLIQGPDNNNIFPTLFIIEQYEEIEEKVI